MLPIRHLNPSSLTENYPTRVALLMCSSEKLFPKYPQNILEKDNFYVNLGIRCTYRSQIPN